MDVDEALDRLYAAPLDEFTSTRNALAARLGEAGDAQGARRIKGLKKPNLAAWALNQLARANPGDVEELFAATGRLRAAQRRALSGGRAAELRQATDERNALVGRLTKVAGSILEAAGHKGSASTLSAVSDSLVAVASDEEGAELLRAGRLPHPLEPSAFVDVGGLSVVPAVEEAETPTDDRMSALAQARGRLSGARSALKAAREATRSADSELRDLERQAQQAEERAKAAREAAEFARRGAEARREEEAAAERAAEEAAAAVRELERG